jgi:hypothetical protein
MKKIIYILISITFSLPIFGQEQYINKNYDCNLLSWMKKKGETELDLKLIKIECLIIRDQFESGMKILDSLIFANPTNGELCATKADYLSRNNRFDTTYISYQKQAIKLNYNLGYSIYHLGDYYYNFLMCCERDKSPLKLSKTQKLELLEFAELNFSKALLLNKKLKSNYLENLAKIKEKRAELTNIKIDELKFSNEFDTLLIISELMDCGEFGGHLEYIKCYHSKGNIVAIFSQDEPFCQNEKPARPPDTSYKTGEQKIDSKILKSYIEHFKKIIKNPDVVTNAPTTFWIIQNSNIYFQRDWTGNSKEYETLRDKTFK